MRSTLFYIPHADPFWGLPLFGTGWLLGLLIVAGLVLLGLRVRQPGWKTQVLSELPLFLLLAAAIVWLAPLVEVRDTSGVPLGIPIRGYGLLVLLGIVGGTVLAVWESQRMGLHPELMLSLCFGMILCGFLGARLFYVLEYWPQFSAPTLAATAGNIVKLTDGGLVVYGSFIGALLTFVVFVVKHKLPVLAVADLLAPGLVLGLALGRLGCFMNGCCWGNHCAQEYPLGVTFPQGSPPYVNQIQDGSLLNMRLERHGDQMYTVRQVEAGGLADQAGLKVGDTIVQILLPPETAFNSMRHGQQVPDALVTFTFQDGRRVSWPFGRLRKRTLPIYPTQIFSSINAALICFFLWAYYPLRRRDGEVAALLLTIYPTTRILLESIRNDEADLFAFGFKLTISQTISLALLLAAVAFWVYLRTRPRGSVLPLRVAA